MSPETRAQKAVSDAETARPWGVYVHFPWCLHKCPYCDFLSVATPRDAIDGARYADAVIAEHGRRRVDLELGPLDSVFFGGGTPSLWDPVELGRALRGILDGESTRDGAEVTVECNPSSLDANRARALVDVGVNRLSVGVQGLDPQRLEFLGRWHDPDRALGALRDALDSGARVSADLIFGVAGQTPESAADEAARVADLGLTHVSAYALTIEPGTQFGARARKGTLPLLDDARIADSFEAVAERLTSLGFEHYEISNFAREGHRARHNLGYWRGHDYLGLGCGAWGTVRRKTDRVRYRNTPSPERYLEMDWSTVDLRDAESHREPIGAKTAMAERVLLGLRLKEGVDLSKAKAELGIDPWTSERRQAVERLVREGRLTRTGDVLSIPYPHWVMADGIVASVM